MDSVTPARRWLDAWVRAWTTHDAAVLADVYAPGTRHRSQAFRDPGDPLAYAEWAFADEHEVECWFAEPWLETGTAAACEWWAVTHSGETVSTLAGVSLLRLDGDGRVTEQSDYWAELEGEQPPPEGWGPVAAHERGVFVTGEA
jgi:hypothetical protein